MVVVQDKAYRRRSDGDKEVSGKMAAVEARVGAIHLGWDVLTAAAAVGARPPRRLAQLGDDVLRRVQIRIAHAEVDDVGALRSGGGLDPVDLLEDVRREALDLSLIHI